jgi:hypothetical protein
VTGIDPAAGIDPTNALAFVTALTFVSNGSFTGTMTPITAQVALVPEPGTAGLLAAGIAGLGLFGCGGKVSRRPFRACG